MERATKLIVAAVALAATITGVAVAASSPTVSTHAATKISKSGARLNGVVNPNGSRTGYTFDYGLTSAYGLVTRGHTAGRGTNPMSVGVGVGGLEPGTVYHYRIVALSRFGLAVGSDHRFKTKGPPPPGVATGAPVSVGKTTATVTGTVATNGAATTWTVQYGPTAAYGSQTFGQRILNSPTPTAVSLSLTGLSPRTLFHYRLVGLHGSRVISYGGDATFYTEPLRRPKPRLTTTTRPSRDRHAPFTFTTTGRLHGFSWIPSGVRCTGNVGLRYFRGRRQVGVALVPVSPSCTFASQARFRHLRGRGPRPVRIKIPFRGNGYIRPVSRTHTVIAG